MENAAEVGNAIGRGLAVKRALPLVERDDIDDMAEIAEWAHAVLTAVGD